VDHFFDYSDVIANYGYVRTGIHYEFF